MNTNPLHILFKLSRPHFLLITLGQAIMGTGLARFLGHKIDWGLFSLGLGWLWSLQLGVHFLIQNFDRAILRKNNLPAAFSFYPGLLGDGANQLPRRVALGSAAGMLTITTIFTMGIAQFNALNPTLVIVMGLIFLLLLAFALPAINLNESGLAELSIAIIIGILVPGFSFLLQANDTHRFIISVTIPLAILLIPVMLAFEFPNYSISRKVENPNLIQQLGWQSAMSVHNTFILVAFLFLGLTAFTGLPLRAVFSPFLALPLAFLQIWQMGRIADGVKPNWRTLTWNAVVIFELVTYMLAFSFWLS